MSEFCSELLWQRWLREKGEVGARPTPDEGAIIAFVGFVRRTIFRPVGTSKKWNENWFVEKLLKSCPGASQDILSLKDTSDQTSPNMSFYFPIISLDGLSQSMSPARSPFIFDLCRS